MTINRPIILAPSILTADFGHLAEEIQAAERGGAEYIHLDVMDGQFVPNITFGPTIIHTVRSLTKLPLDVHLMVDDPDRYLELFAEAGADLITVHLEACRHLHRTVQQIVGLGCKAGVALNPSTGVESVREIAPFVDMILIMSVNPGFGSQRFIETSTSKLRRMRELLDQFNPTCDLEIDGGIGTQNIADVIDSGANVIVTGSAIFNKEGSVEENLATMKAAIAAG